MGRNRCYRHRPAGRGNGHQGLINGAAFVLLVALCIGCGGQGAGALLLAGDATGARQHPPQAPVLTLKDPSGFELRVLPETFTAGGQAKIELTVSETADGALVQVNGVAMRRLKAFVGELAYPAVFTPSEGAAGAGLGPAEQVLCLCVLDQPGAVQLAAALKGCAVAHGADGAAELARVRFTRGAAAASTARQASTPPVSLAAAPKLAVNCTTQEVQWWHNLPGDFNQDGVVSAPDLVTFASHYGEIGQQMPRETYGAPNPSLNYCTAFALDSEQAVVDFDGSGKIGMEDLSAMGANFGTRVTGWNVYASANPAADYPDLALGGAAPSKITPVDSQSFFDDAIGDPLRERLHFNMALPSLDDGMAYWVRPVDDQGAEGTPSNWAPYDASLAGDFRYCRGEATFLPPVRGWLDLEVSTTGPDEALAAIQASIGYLYALDGVIFYDPAKWKPVRDADDRYDYPQGLGGVDDLGTYLILDSFGIGNGWAGMHCSPNAHLDWYHGAFRAVQLKFLRGSEPQTPPTGVSLASSSVVAPLVSYDPGTTELSWFHCLRADCNQDGIGNENDIATVHYYYFGYGDPADPTGVSILADANQDGIVNISDITYIGRLYGRLNVTGYNVYATLNPDEVPVINGDTESAPTIAPIGHVGLYDQPWNSCARKRFTFTVPAPQSGMYLWVQPEDHGVVGGMKQGCYVQVP